MASKKACSLDEFVPSVLSSDTRRRLQTHEQLVNYLQQPSNPVGCREMDRLIDGLVAWISSSSFKVAIAGLEVVACLIDRLQEGFSPYVCTVLPAVIDRLGDGKDQVRDVAHVLLLRLMVPASSPQFVVDKMALGFTHKVSRVREEILKCLQRALAEFGAKSVTLSKVVPFIVKMLDDTNLAVKEQATNTLLVIYQHVGERLRTDLTKKDIHPSKLAPLFARMDELRQSELIASDVRNDDRATPKRTPPKPEDEPDGARMSKGASGSASSGTLGRGKTVVGAGDKGAVDEDTFEKQFEQISTVNIYSVRELTDRITKIRDTLSDVNADWTKRVDMLKDLRGCFLAGAMDYADFITMQLPTLEPCFQQSVRDLRSQVVREACITIGYMARELGKDFGHFAESVLPPLMLLIPNSVRIMATSGTTAIRYIIRYTHMPRLIPIVTSYMTSKSSVIRKQCCEFILLMVQAWPTQTLERHITALQDSIKKGISDADADARGISRKAFWGFADHFRGQADAMLMSLDVAKQKQLMNDQPSTASSSTSLNSLGRSSCPATPARSAKPRQISIDRGSVGSAGADRNVSSQLNRTPVGATSRYTSSRTSDTTPVLDASRGVRPSRGSHSAGNTCQGVSVSVTKSLSEVSRQLAQNNYSSLRSTHKRSASFSAKHALPLTHSYDEYSLSLSMSNAGARPRKSSMTNGNSSHHGESPAVTSSAERSRTRARSSQSQPSSRSGSPSARLSYLTQQPDLVHRSSASGRTHGGRSGLPCRSQGASRENSPSRGSGRERRYSGGQALSGTTARRGRSARDLLHTDDVETAVADALHKTSSRGRVDSYDSDDFVSETSSVCSDSGSRTYRPRPQTEDVSEIMSYMSAGAWSDRRDGLYALQGLIQSGRGLTRGELKRVTEIFTRMFHDPHGKVFGVFLDTLAQFVPAYNTELTDWLYICLTRLLSKTGTDMLASVQSKIQRTLDVIRGSFPASYQFTLLARFIVDQTQSPNIKVKVSMLSYMHSLVLMLEPSDFVNSSDIRLAVSRIVTWTTEPKSVDVRKAAQAVLIALYNLNRAEFMTMLSVLPKTFQDGANRIIDNHLRSAASMDTLSQSSVSPVPSTASSTRYRAPSGNYVLEDRSDAATIDRMRPDEIQDSIRRTTADIRQFVNVKSDYSTASMSPPTAKKDALSRSGVAEATMMSRPDGAAGALPASYHIPVVRSPERRTSGQQKQYNASTYQDKSKPRGARRKLNVDDADEYYDEDDKQEQKHAIQDILIELSHHSERADERKSALLTLIKKAREERQEVWDEYFNPVLLILLETAEDDDAQIRALTLRVLAEFLRCHVDRFGQYIEATIVKTLEAHRDPIKEVTRAAEECAMLLARFVAPDRTILALVPMVEGEDYPINLASIKMLTQLMENSNKETVIDFLPDIMPGLLKGYDHTQSSVRKAAVLCLVALYLLVGEEIRPFILSLNGSKLKLLNVYIKRALEQRGDSYVTSENSSPTSAADALS